MNRKFLTAALAFAVLGVLGALWIQRYTGSDAFWDSESSISEQDLRSTAERLYSQPNTPNPRPPSWPPEQRVRLAIGGLGLPEPVTRETVDLLTALLTNEPDLDLVERQSLDRVLAEIHLALSGLVRANDAVRVGHLLQADWFLLGSVVAAGGNSTVIARVVDARTGVLIDAGAFEFAGGTMRLSEQLAAFLLNSRRRGRTSDAASYLAIG
ncbi:MAG: hypothetical protein KJ072_24250, partial [Verrucomicrobia bacterium]|nr:hypothetical protein [Verrucomicrobiota bacterium]